MDSYALIKILEAFKTMQSRLNQIEPLHHDYTSTDTKDLEVDFTKAQGEFKPVKQDKENKFLKYSYASFDAMADYARSILSKHNLNFKQHIICDKNGYNILITRLNHVSGQWSESRMRIVASTKSNGNVHQEMGATITYYKRYCLGSLLGLSVGDIDLDA